MHDYDLVGTVLSNDQGGINMCVYARERECDSKEVEIQVFGVKEVVHGGFQEAHN